MSEFYELYKSRKVRHTKPMELDRLSPEVAKEVIQKRQQGWSYQKLADFIRKKTKGEIKVSLVTVREWLLRRQVAARKLIFGTQEYRDRIAQEYCQILLDARIICDGLVRRFEKVEREGGKTSELCKIADTFIQYYEAIRKTLVETSNIPELKTDIPKAIREIQVKYRSVMPEEKGDDVIDISKS